MNSTPSYDIRDGVLFISCRYCRQLVPANELGRHLRAHRSSSESAAPVHSPRHSASHARRHEKRRERIRQVCLERGIERVVHFTPIENLARILREGLLPRFTLDRLSRRGRPFIAVDQDRFDGHKRTVSVSISFPNYQMFYRVRQQTSDDVWVVLSMKPALLWELDCAFCEDNAASADVRRRPLPTLKRVEALQALFSEVVLIHDGRILRAEISIPDLYPTNPQAEVLVCEPVKPRYIFEVAFFDRNRQWQWIEKNGNHWPGVNLTINHGLFRPRPGNWDNLARALKKE